MKTRYERLAEKSESIWSDKWMSLPDWNALTPEQRVIHYQRNRVPGCDHSAESGVWPEPLRVEYSFDPYAHIQHMMPHDIKKFFMGTCECQTCVLRMGIEDGKEIRKVNEEQVREKLKMRQSHTECFCDRCWKTKRPALDKSE